MRCLHQSERTVSGGYLSRKAPLLVRSSCCSRPKQANHTAVSDQQWLCQAHVLHKRLQHVACSGSGKAALQADSFEEVDDQYGQSDSDEYASEEEVVQSRKSAAPAAHKTQNSGRIQAVAMPKRAKASQQPLPAVSPARYSIQQVRVFNETENKWTRLKQADATAEHYRALARRNSTPAASADSGIGDYDRRAKTAGHVAGTGVLRYEDTEEGQEKIRKWAARQEKDRKRQEITDAFDADYISGMRPPPSAREEEDLGETGDELSKAGLQLKSKFTPDFPWAVFEAAAQKLKERLEPAVRMEDDEQKTAIQQLYSKTKVSELAKSGLILLNLRATITGELYGDAVWRFSPPPGPVVQPAVQLPAAGATATTAGVRQRQQQSPGASTAQRGTRQVQAGNSQGGLRQPAAKGGKPVAAASELPYNRFKSGEGILISNFQGQEDVTTFAGTLLEVKKTHVLIVLDIAKSEALINFIKGQGKTPSFRLDKQALEATTTRQLQALEKVSQFRSISEALMKSLGQRSMKDLEIQFKGELTVKMILLGMGSVGTLAGQPPIWATGGSRQADGQRWRNEAGAYIRSFETLNRSQQEAITKAILRRFTLWQGPPGTGKTRTLLAFMEVMVNSRPLHPFTPILACADTNAAVDNIVEGLAARRINVVRLGQPAKVRTDLRSVCLEALTERTPDGQKALQLRKEADRLMEKFNKGGELFEKLTPTDLAAIKNTATLKQRLAKNLIRDASTEVLRNCQVVAATCAGAGDESRLHNQVFRLVVIDEATQATEPSTLIPLVRGAESVVMAGDPKQLPPTVISRGAELAGLQVTVFDRLQKLGIEPLLLDTQYRMHPLIAHIPSKLFYGGRLKSGVTARERPLPVGFPWPNPTCPVALIPCDYGKEQTGQASRTTLMAEGAASVAGDVAESGASFKNETEAALAIRVLEGLLMGGDVQSAALLTPYNGQVRELQRRFLGNKRLAAYEGMVDISSVDGYQGREADVIVMSTVRCNREGKLGFVTDPRRLNVAISRPRRGLVIVGSPQTLISNPNWREWLKWVRSQNALLHSDDLN